MFGFLNMMDNYEQRKVARFEESGLIIDTAAVTDSSQPYETGIKHPKYRGGNWIIVELYGSKSVAEAGHEKWVKTMTAKELPKSLKDVSTCDIIQLGSVLGMDLNGEFAQE
jgi:hypothetical protein